MDRDPQSLAGMIFRKAVQIQAPPAKVWQVLTTPALMRQWLMPEIDLAITINWVVGNPLLISGSLHGLDFENRGAVVQFEPESALSYTHLSSISRLPDRPENYVSIDFRLQSIEDGTALTLTIRNFPTQSIYQHLAFYWNVTLEILKRVAEAV